ncbi:hypothetical protein OOO38_004670 [Salmonella enterica]|nr:hypothetical protein [Salmonella enterica]EKC2694039.1 hypothetical protein [Salmonella enterica]
MTKNKKEEERYKIKIKTKRELNILKWFVMQNRKILSNYLSSSLKNEKRINSIHRFHINNASALLLEIINDYYSHNQDCVAYYGRKTESFLDSVIPASETEWFKKNELACYFVWFHIKHFYPILSPELLSFHRDVTPHKFISDARISGLSELYYANINHPDEETKRETDAFLKEISSLYKQPSSHTERYESILFFLDLVPSYFNEKLAFITNIRNEWTDKFRYKRKLSIPESNEDLCQWAWEYMKNKPFSRRRIYNKSAEINPSPNVCCQESKALPGKPPADNPSTVQDTASEKASYRTKQFMHGETGHGFVGYQTGWYHAFNIVQPQTPKETYLAVHAVWLFYVSGTATEHELYQQFKRARDTFLTRQRKKKNRTIENNKK